MATVWSLTRERIADKALGKCGVLGVGKTPSDEDRTLALEALDAILKELPLYGYVWPKVNTAQTDLTLNANTSPTGVPDANATTLPTDVYALINIMMVNADGNEYELYPMTLLEWEAVADKDLTADYPTHYYLGPDQRLWTWPIQTSNRTAKVRYQRIIDDTVSGQAPDIGVPWIRGLIKGIAAEIGDEFGVPASDIQRWESSWIETRTRGISATNKVPFTIEVED